jgi:hypothetical protein
MGYTMCKSCCSTVFAFIKLNLNVTNCYEQKYATDGCSGKINSGQRPKRSYIAFACVGGAFALQNSASTNVADGSKAEELTLSRTSPLNSPTADIGADIDLRRCGPKPEVRTCGRRV